MKKGSRRHDWSSFGDDQKREESRRRTRDRAVRGVKGTDGLEERAARGDDTFRLVVDGKSQLPVEDVAEDEPRMTMPRSLG